MTEPNDGRIDFGLLEGALDRTREDRLVWGVMEAVARAPAESPSVFEALIRLRGPALIAATLLLAAGALMLREPPASPRPRTLAESLGVPQTMEQWMTANLGRGP